MAKYSLKADERDLPCPICAAPAGERCRTDGHRLARRKAWKTYVRRNSADVLFREDLLAEVSEAAERRGESLPDFIEAAVEARLVALRTELEAA